MELLLLAVGFLDSVVGAICGIGGRINKKISAQTVNRLFIGFMFVIIAISIRNSFISFR